MGLKNAIVSDELSKIEELSIKSDQNGIENGFAGNGGAGRRKDKIRPEWD